MFSLRAASRALPRTGLRLASAAPKTSFLSSIKSSPVLRRTATPPSIRTFTSAFRLRDDASQELAAKLSSEIALESEDASTPADSETNIKQFLDLNPHWTLTDESSTQEVLLSRQYEDETITVAFSIVDFNTPMEMSGSEEMDEALMDEEDVAAIDGQSGGGNTKGVINQGKTSGGNFKVAPEDSVAPADREGLRSEEEELGAEDQEGQEAFPANVGVLVQRKGKGALRISLIADNGMFNIQSVTHLPDNKTFNAKTPAEILRSTEAEQSLYTGPPFQQLDEEVQSLLEQYLDVRGINTHLALFVPEYIDVKEQREYLGWLERVRGFVE